jgi:hypothetical protein
MIATPQPRWLLCGGEKEQRDLGLEVGANEVMKGFGEDKSFVEFIGLL